MAPQTPKPAEPLATPTAQQMHSALTALEPRQTVFAVDALQRVQEEQAPYLPFAPLFLPNWTRAILAHALATLSVGGSLDIPKLIYLLAQGQPIVQLPNLPWPTLVRGVQVLMDLSEEMLPYRKDQLWLVDELEKTVGQDKVKILSFAAAPLLGAGATRRALPTARSAGARRTMLLRSWRPLPAACRTVRGRTPRLAAGRAIWPRHRIRWWPAAGTTPRAD